MNFKQLHTNKLANSVIYGWNQLCSRPVYLMLMIVVPLFSTFFFLDFMNEGLPQKLPSAIVDQDNTPVSRTVTRNLDASELVDINYKVNTYAEAMDLVKQGKIYGFFMIPRNFQSDAEAGRHTTITYYTNMAYFVPGTLSYKSFKTTAVSTKGVISSASLIEAGVSKSLVSNMVQPVVTQIHPLGNPWANYSIYLSNSFLPGLLELIIFQITAFSILQEIKRGTSVKWLHVSGNSIIRAVAGKLIPQFFIFAIVGLCMQGIIYGFWHFPLKGSVWAMAGAMIMLVLSSQAFALAVVSIIPNLRFALSILSLFGILAFSIAGFSFPCEDMYGPIAIFSYMMPVRHYFLIYINVALNGYPVYYVRWQYVAMLMFTLAPLAFMWKLKKESANPVYIP
ncbi:ABC transporter permease [uncultured Muribaculum sp.]|uniref:ABC transporter permease n=1 Tax=uncultured Muribaculum sp. TaxID=1918613 RepID=UPI0025B014B5|nr:ABC transporter permease [uncultured Muribaculum sp.]